MDLHLNANRVRSGPSSARFRPRAAWLAAVASVFAACAPAAGRGANPSAASPPVTARPDPDSVLAASAHVSQRMYAAGGNTLTRTMALRAMDAEYEADPVHRQAVSLTMVRVAAELGAYREALAHADRLYGTELLPSPSSPVPVLDGFRPVDAAEYVARAADTARVVMINEAHHVPQHRAFTRSLLATLHAKGFRYFAAEALSESDTALNTRGYPIPRSGGYLAEPVFGDLVRTALQLGYRVVPYESRDPRADRDLTQAGNLVRRILERDPAARVLVHAGWSHIDESGLLNGAPPMGTQFRRLAGIDPLTIDQTIMTERASPAFEHPLYAAVVDRRGVARPTAFVGPDGRPWTLEPGKRDVTIFHPRSVYRGGRPTWLSAGEVRQRIRLAAEICGTAERCLVRARVESEAPNAIPMDQVEVVHGGPVPELVLPPGAYLIQVEDQAGNAVSSARRVVRAR
ncbi:MAG TPA: hypothetical protein VF710_03685 [Longimicrobium sp.]|jgi:hypothetical protein